jgi:hypothetical protein
MMSDVSRRAAYQFTHESAQDGETMRFMNIAMPALLTVLATFPVVAAPADQGQSAGGASRASSAAGRQAVIDILHEVLPEDVVQAVLADALQPDADELPGVIKTPTPIIVRGANLRGVPVKHLPPVDVAALLAEDAHMAQFNKALRFGVGRNLLADLGDGAWAWLAGDANVNEPGWLWVMDIHSEGAVAMRIRALNMTLPPGATLIAYDPVSPQTTVVGPYEERGPFEDGEIWMPTIVSPIVRVECWVPASALAGASRAGAAAPTDPLFVLDRIQHVYRDPLREEFDRRVDGGVGDAERNGVNDTERNGGDGGEEGGIAGGGCHNQVACHPEFLDLARAVGGIGTLGENSIWCTGQLIRTEADDKTPYFLTAHHCLSFNFEARDAEIYWQYQAPTCGASPPGLATVEQSNVCTLVRTGSGSDYTLLMIEGPVDPDSTFASWTGVDAANGAEVVCIHHPQGRQKRISFGTKAGNPTCGGALTHVRSNWNDGITQPGSSGGGLFRADNGQLIGQLHCGSSDCGQVTNDSFGAFFATYPLISDKLDEGDDDDFEPNRTCNTAPLITPGVYNNRVVKSVDVDWYRISVPAGQRLTVRAQFKHIWGDIDMRLYGGCGASPIDTSAGTGNTETVTWVNNTGSSQFRRVRVYLFNDVRATYKLTVTLEDA